MGSTNSNIAVLEHIDIEMIENLSRIAEIYLTQEEAEELLLQFNQQLKYANEIRMIDVHSVEPVFHGVPYIADHNAPLREDNVEEYTNLGKLMRNAPANKDGYFIVPAPLPHIVQ